MTSSTHTHTSGERASGSAPAVPSSLLCVGPALLLLIDGYPQVGVKTCDNGHPSSGQGINLQHTAR
jgi:hypothetical protein